MSTITLYRNNDNLIEWEAMAESSDGAFQNSATVTFTLYTGYSVNTTTGAVTGTPVTDANAVAMPYVSDSNGKYQGSMPSTVTLSLTTTYILEINANSDGRIAKRAFDVTVLDRNV